MHESHTQQHQETPDSTDCWGLRARPEMRAQRNSVSLGWLATQVKRVLCSWVRRGCLARKGCWVKRDWREPADSEERRENWAPHSWVS